ncbi:acetyl-CoA hydrolase/transferase family protein [Alistipes sp.]|uniref:acetyl-CoA hydrolase/transferase family protein n=1 Tax=Alistipes sp. TaxID=1872444 RepID=UPI003AEFD264
MNFKLKTPAEAVRLISSGDSVYIQGSTSIPEVLVQAMTDRAAELRGVKIYSGFAVGRADAPYCRPELRDSFLVNSLFVANNIRRHLAAGDGQSIPAFLGEIPGLFRDGTLPVDVALVNLSRPDAEGYCSYGVSADLAVSAVDCARIVIAQINRAMPFSYGDAVIHLSEVDAAVEVDEPLVEVPTATPTETETRIGRYIAELIPDGATLQIGVGGIPNAVLAALKDHKHLGLHTEAMTDGVLPLLESGVIDNSLKTVMPGVSVASLALGSRRLYDYMDYRKDLVMKDVAWTNDPFRIRQNPRVMAINSAVEVDLTGQVCADSVGQRIISGVGGQHDFMYGGSLSEGGKTFIAIPSTTPRGESKIKALLTPGAGVVTTRHMVQHIVTEYGVAHLRGKNLAERARALIAVAHPAVREELERAAAERFGHSFLRIK